jgi:hypothetical protein
MRGWAYCLLIIFSFIFVLLYNKKYGKGDFFLNIKNKLFNPKYNKRIKNFIIMLIVISCFSTILSTTGFTAKTSYVAEEFPNSGVKQFAWFFVYNVFGTTMIEDVQDIINFDPAAPSATPVGAAVKSVWGFVKTIYTLITPIAYGLILLYFLLDVLEKTTHEQMSIEHFFRSCIKLIIAIVFINQGFSILTYGVQFVTAITNGLVNRVGLSPPTNDWGVSALDSYYDDISAASGFEGFALCVGFAFQLILPFIILWVAKLVVELVAWGRIIELGVRGAFAPIGMSDLFTEGTKGGGFRYLKKFLGVAFQGAVIMAVLICYQYISAAINGGSGALDPIGAAFSQCVVSLTVMTVLLKTQNMANDLVGA